MINNDTNQPHFSLIADFDGDVTSLFDVKIDEVAVLPARNMVLFPGVVMPIHIGRASSLKLIKDVHKKDAFFAINCQLEEKNENPTLDQLYPIGTLGKIVKVIELPHDNLAILVQGYARVKLTEEIQSTPYMRAKVECLDEILPSFKEKEIKALVASCKDLALKQVELSDNLREELGFAIRNLSNPMCMVNFICSNLPFSTAQKIDFLKESSLVTRAEKLLKQLRYENQFVEIKNRIQKETREELDVQQKQYYLRHLIKNIQEELGEGDTSDIESLLEKSMKKKFSKEVETIFHKELNKLKNIDSRSPDYNVQMNYLQTLLSLPWGEYSKDNLKLETAEKILNKDHYGLEKVKERILEHLSVLKMRNDMKSPILCLYGPPGVGKTSLGKSVADALKRKYVRISLGGVHDEAEIRGHRKTYIGAMPGRIIKSIIKAGTNNPVFILDEIDKVSGNTVHGDPSSALLEVLDPEQNTTFHDNFLDVDYDLSKILFIATANDIHSIPQPLLDRMELINISGYLTEEKIEIAKRHLIPKGLIENGLKKNLKIKIQDNAIEKVIESYTRESGVRQLEKQLNKILRKITHKFVKGEFKENKNSYTLTAEEVEKYLGKPIFNRDKYQGNKDAGVVTGLAWTSVGGEILFVETSISKGKGQLTLTGNLGDVMKESAVLALEYIKAHAQQLEINEKIFNHWNIHIHVPEGAVPKDGPSAGITIATSLVSALTQRKVRANVAMTGEITLRGKVLPVGGIKDKILAAKRAGITDIVLCKENKKDIEEIAENYLEGLTFHYVENINEVLNFALLNEKVEYPVDFTIPNTEEK